MNNLIDQIENYKRRRTSFRMSDSDWKGQVVLGAAATQSNALFYGFIGYKLYQHFTDENSTATLEDLFQETVPFITSYYLTEKIMHDIANTAPTPIPQPQARVTPSDRTQI